jgi:cell fate regulator YaaT (PSP1 superfamily)
MPRYVLRYGSTRAVGLFSPRGQDRYARGMKVIARTPRGLEAAEVLAEASDEQAKMLEGTPGGQIVREMSAEDANELTHLQDRERNAFEKCQKQVTRLSLPMQLVDVEHVFGGERLVVYYISEERVDFRDLVKALASEFQTRIEMRQIGVRDEAKLLADYGDCGQPVCCGTFLSEMPPVSMKMAKVQKATLDPTKISGRCGRLKCCLRYEYDIYEDLQRDLPPIGSDIITKNGRARVLAQEILAQQLLVAMEDNRRILIPAGDVVSVIKAGTGRRPDRPEGERGRRRGGERERGREGEPPDASCESPNGNDGPPPT